MATDNKLRRVHDVHDLDRLLAGDVVLVCYENEAGFPYRGSGYNCCTDFKKIPMVYEHINGMDSFSARDGEKIFSYQSRKKFISCEEGMVVLVGSKSEINSYD